MKKDSCLILENGKITLADELLLETKKAFLDISKDTIYIVNKSYKPDKVLKIKKS
jgi:hypothetical protein